MNNTTDPITILLQALELVAAAPLQLVKRFLQDSDIFCLCSSVIFFPKL